MTGRGGSSRTIIHRRLQWLVGFLSFLVGMLSFQMLHASFELQGSSSLLDCPTTPTDGNEDNAISSKTKPETTKTTITSKTSSKKFAYAFLISGCDPSSPLTYRPYIYNILVATKNLVDSGSRADVVVMIQMVASSKQKNDQNATSTAQQELPPSDLQWLQMRLNPDNNDNNNNNNNPIRIRYLPPLLRDNFYSAQLAKFHILELTEYERVMYLDADVMPLCNLDYLMELSTNSILQPNIVLAWFTEPSHGGLFVLKPGQYDEWEAVVERREQEALQLPYPHWDPVRGWGHVLTEEWTGLPQPVETFEDTGLKRYIEPRHSTNWTFHGDFCDQGLLYYWTRFHQKAVSILYLDTVVDHVGDGDQSSTMIRSSREVFSGDTNYSCLPPGKEYLGQYGSTLQPPLFYDKIPHRDFVHFSGQSKPWEEAPPRPEFPTTKGPPPPPLQIMMMMMMIRSSTDYWYFQLQQIFQAFALQYPQRKLPTLPLKYKAPTLGRYPTHRSMIGTIQKKLRKRNQQQQEQRQEQQRRQEGETKEKVE